MNGISESSASNMEKVFIEGNEALAYGALQSGLNCFFGYPITPSTEVAETLARELGNPRYPDFKVFVQASSEIESVNMLIGAGAMGALAMTATSSPGFSLMQEGISYAVGMEIPFVIANANRAGPGLGSLGPEQGDMWKASRGGGHGDYRCIVLSAHTATELANLPFLAFELAFKYRNPVIILYDSYIAKLKEDAEVPIRRLPRVDRSWTLGQQKERGREIMISLNLEPEKQEAHEQNLQEKFRVMKTQEQRCEEYLTDDAEVILVAYGIVARLAKRLVHKARREGLKAGLVRPITLWPPPYDAWMKYVEKGVPFLVVELNAGQIYEDVKAATQGRCEVEFHGSFGGMLPSLGEVEAKMRRLIFWRAGR